MGFCDCENLLILTSEVLLADHSGTGLPRLASSDSVTKCRLPVCGGRELEQKAILGGEEMDD